MRHQAQKYGHADTVAFHEQAIPEIDEVMQRSETPVCVSVKHDGPVTTSELPSRFGTVCVEIATISPQQVLGGDRRRTRATLLSTDNAFLVSITRSINGTRTAALWPANVPLILTHCEAVTIATSTGTAAVSIITENWAD